MGKKTDAIKTLIARAATRPPRPRSEFGFAIAERPGMLCHADWDTLARGASLFLSRRYLIPIVIGRIRPLLTELVNKRFERPRVLGFGLNVAVIHRAQRFKVVDDLIVARDPVALVEFVRNGADFVIAAEARIGTQVDVAV